MAGTLILFILLPFLGFAVSLVIPHNRERLISLVALGTIGVHLLAAALLTTAWLGAGAATLHQSGTTLSTQGLDGLGLCLIFDKITAVYLLTGALLTILIVKYSRYYLHREPGYKRFFRTVLLFFLGYNIIIFSGNYEVLFIGWEVLGISSFLLIAFYRNRLLPVRNALKVFSIYRLADVGILLAMWMSHHLWHGAVPFDRITSLPQTQLPTPEPVVVFISMMILLAAAAKSAQLPFSFWLPRAMEGPTPSTAIFYGSLSVHIGVFLLMRTWPFWQGQLLVRILIGATGLLTSLVTTLIARVQPTVKGQIAYASVSQIGLIFVEVAAGFENAALIHFMGNAFLRTYQLLVSPSVVSFLVANQPGPNFTRRPAFATQLPTRFGMTLYMLAIQEFNLDALLNKCLWVPLKSIGRSLGFFSARLLALFFIPVYLGGVYLAHHQQLVHIRVRPVLALAFAIVALGMTARAFAKQRDIKLGWVLLVMAHFWIALSASFNENFSFAQVYLYLSGVVLSGGIGLLCLNQLGKTRRHIGLSRFHGYIETHPGTAAIFFLSCLGLAGFPITPTFIGEDLMFSHIHQDQPVLAFLVSAEFVLSGLALVRIYARLFLGPDTGGQNELTYGSS
ncbi:MAG: hypothetical protein J7619_01425 [Dyadobacter sp.]|uniref:proton-conducting transporter transmembrane domain-containing protein n=1 Tax=Dyadobacter sp. TaxID=1914288 RepID=UPI001B08F2CC|nr:proton-conducting transporter membrane subunit [Dyadobacter sp.]MBO9611320.1 hypothetical protein [Dyadobacter sp.]